MGANPLQRVRTLPCHALSQQALPHFWQQEKPQQTHHGPDLAETVERAARDGITLPDITVHTFRHSYAVNLLIHGVKRDQLQLWMGHSDPESTLVYTRLLSIDSGFAQPEISFSVAPADNPLLATPTRHRLSE